MHIQSIQLVSHNEDGKEELTIERDLFLLEVIRFIFEHKSFKLPKSVKETYVFVGRRYVDPHAHWMDKVTGKAPEREKELELDECRREVRRNSRSVDELASAQALTDLKKLLRK